nr:hypothetical protein [Tanacetum cinerariifolium]
MVGSGVSNIDDGISCLQNDDSDSEVEEVGLNRTPKQSEIRQVVSENNLSVCVILESHVELLSILSSICYKVFRSWDWTSNASICAKGCRIILGWNKDVVDVMVVAQSDLVIHAKADLDKHKLVARGFPWVLMGDFNVALNIEDSHLRSSLMTSDMCDFKDCVKKIEVIDINSYGLHFTWNQKPKESNGILKKLDRIMGNLDFVDKFPGAYALFQPYQISDHSPAVLKMPSLSVAKPKPFKFYNFLAHKDKFAEVVASTWCNQISGHAMFQVTQKMKLLKKPLRKLLHDQENLHERVDRLRVKLDAVQKALDADPSNYVLRDEEAVYIQAFNEAKIDEERFLRQKAKIEWLEVGDTNSAYFHKSVKSRNQWSRIDVVTTSDNVTVTGNEVPGVFVSHYESFLRTNMACSYLDTMDLFDKRVSNTSNANMIRGVTNAEIMKAMFDIGDIKSLGPDGYTLTFFKKGWDVVGEDVCRVVRDFFTNGKLLKEVNHTFLALIPKVATSTNVTDFRPISSCNVLYKCISKILTNRIIEGIKEVVSENQSAFVPGRRISYNILLTQELMHNYHRNMGPPRCAFKVDIQKACDTVDWRFLGFILMKFVFHQTMIKWIMACVTSPSYSISINGNIHGFFKGKCGIRQGDPLSPYLFTLVMEVLTLILHRRVRLSDSFRVRLSDSFQFHKQCEELNIINLCFVNDLFLFTRGDFDSAKVIMESLDEFKGVSGLVPSIPKSTSSFGDFFGVMAIISEGKRKWLGMTFAFLNVKVGNGLTTFVRYDRWCLQGPLIRFLTPRDIAREGFTLQSCIADLIVNGTWNWPNAWLAKAPTLGTIAAPILYGECSSILDEIIDWFRPMAAK